ncbi:NADPH2:quinone reductase [Thozetella sp. PMI_491]|nr:NADPH2:quinone reductase [Thozetella sp. PMI_491]
MRAVILSGTGGHEKLQYSDSHPTPKLSHGQILVKNTYSGFNFVDVYYRTGLYPSASGYPLIIGQEGVGVVVSVQGNASAEFKVGDRVVWIGQAGYAEYTAVPSAQAIRILPEVSDMDAVGSHLAGMTALSLVKEAFPAVKGQTVLVHAAAGGVGLLLCQLLREEGVNVIGSAGGTAKCELARQNGATYIIDYSATEGPSWMEQVRELTGGQGVDAVYDSVGKDTWKGSIEVTKRKGKVVFYGSASGPVPTLDLALIRAKNLSVIQPTLPNYIATRVELEHYAYGVLERVRDGRLKVNKSRVYALADVAQAHKDAESRVTSGKLVLKL